MVAMSLVVLCVDLCGTAESDEPKCKELTKNSLRIRLYLSVGKITKVRQDCLLAGGESVDLGLSVCPSSCQTKMLLSAGSSEIQ